MTIPKKYASDATLQGVGNVPDDYNLTADEIAILAPRQNVIGGAFKGSVALGATVFFVQKVADNFPDMIPKAVHNRIPKHLTGYALMAGLAVGAISGAHAAIKSNAQIDTFTRRLKDAQRHAIASQDISR